MKYQFPAILTHEEEGVINVSFPDLLGVYTFGTSREEALTMAKDVLFGVLESMEHFKEVTPTPLEEVKQKYEDVVMVEVVL
jgi:predicted RNase H-like HicB family nuclease